MEVESVELTIPERLRLLALLPSKGYLSVMQSVMRLKKELMLDEEIKNGTVTVDKDPSGKAELDQVTWKIGYVKAVEMFAEDIERVRQMLHDMNADGEVTVSDVSLFGKFHPTP